jgi:hypothetical protein
MIPKALHGFSLIDDHIDVLFRGLDDLWVSKLV